MTEVQRNQLVTDNIALVGHTATRLKGRLPGMVDWYDLRSAGYIGLMHAARKWNPAKGVRFDTYASYRIRGAMLDDLRDTDWLPRMERIKLKALGREDTIPKMLSIDDRPHSDDDEPMSDIVEDRKPLQTELFLKSKLPNEYTRGLKEKERRVLKMYYEDSFTMQEIGAVVGVCESRVCQIHKNAVDHLRGRFKVSTSELLCIMCDKPVGKNKDRERLILCPSCYGVKKIRWDRMEVLGINLPGEPRRRANDMGYKSEKVCVVCGKGKIPKNKTVKNLSMCWNCYGKKDVRAARLKALGLEPRGGRTAKPIAAKKTKPVVKKAITPPAPVGLPIPSTESKTSTTDATVFIHTLPARSRKPVELGDEVRDTVSGFAGIVTGRSEFLAGCMRIGIQPECGKDGKLPEDKWFDEPLLSIVTRGKVTPRPTAAGGPMPSIPTRNEVK